MSIPYWPSSGKLSENVTISSCTRWLTYLLSRFSSDPFLCSVAMKSVSGLVMRNCSSRSLPANTRASWWVTGSRPNSLVALAGPHSPDAQSGSGTITVCKSSQTILNLHTLLNFIGSPVRYSRGVTALAKISRRRAPEHGACTRKATSCPTTDWDKEGGFYVHCKKANYDISTLEFQLLQKIRILKSHMCWMTYLHDKSFERNRVVLILVRIIEFEIVVKYERWLHVTGHPNSNSGSSWERYILLSPLWYFFVNHRHLAILLMSCLVVSHSQLLNNKIHIFFYCGKVDKGSILRWKGEQWNVRHLPVCM